ncbi:MAG: ComEC/Rec2 family competence protein [Phoenicibacter congonensis]|uniref:ComEC/Rec2 family competence protein n=1 Tax=Phoenicibacter congonensis TaxID=1944646 RepID=A0AA43U8U8_9ACTN|nr:ComEC/Rec2 family competence protein [Phoenicibacter congonensis]
MINTSKKSCITKIVAVLAAFLLAISALFVSGCTKVNVNFTDSSSKAQAANFSSTGELKVRFVDVGQGDCALISFDNHWMMIDGGKPSASSVVHTVLNRLGVTEIEYMVASHPDSDHSGGLAGALNLVKVDHFMCSTTESDTTTWKNIKKQVEEQGLEIEVPKVGDTFKLGDATVTILGPTDTFESDNNNSIVLRIDYGNKSFLFTGDMEHESENSMLKAGTNVKADVLKVSHHGSRTASSVKFLKQVSPEYAVISCGKDNDYGHPHEETLKHLKKVNTTVLRTDELGDIIFTTDGNSLDYTSTDKITE